MKLFRTRIFKKDYQKLKMTDTQYTKYIKFLSMLLDGKELPLEARNHNLIGNYSSFKELHIGGDLLVIYLIEEWYDFRNQTVQRRDLKSDKGGTMRLGEYPCVLIKDTNAFETYGKEEISERHRHRYEVNPKYIEEITAKGLIFSGHHIRKDDTKLMEFIELKDHKFFCATQAHPEFKSSLGKPSPLFNGFVKACKD